MQFTVDVYAWIPQADVPNPLHSLRGGTSLLGPGACGPRFGGDNFAIPPPTTAGWSRHTYRARQQLRLDTTRWGLSPVSYSTAGVIAGTTTVLTAPRPSGTVCHSMTATVEKSSASVAYSAADNWYEVVMRGKVMDPYPAVAGAHVGGNTLGNAGRSVAGALTPSLEWDLLLRIQRGPALGRLTQLRYAADCPLATLDAKRPNSKVSLGTGTSNLAHGTIEVRRYPSYVVYLSLGSTTQIMFFADASARNPLPDIAIPQDSRLRDVHW